MFTGIIRHTGRFEAFRKGKKEMVIEAPEGVTGLGIGESVAVDGVCLSLIGAEGGRASFNLSEETLTRTTLGRCRRGDLLNLETPLTLQAPLSGHLVTGHIDRTERILRVTPRREGKRITVSLSPNIRPFFIAKGSAAVNGVSLTVAEVGASSFDVEIIPITLRDTNLGGLRPGDAVNIESDMIGKYVYNWLLQNK